jgi:uncharacterized protein
MQARQGRRRVAVVGSGVSGLVAAYVLARHDHVTLYEADDRLGGHADTHRLVVAGDTIAVDTGFIVHNDRTYPTLLRLFAELGVPTQESDMSMSVRDEASGLEYAGALGPRGLFPAGRNLGNPRYLRMLTDIRRFHRRARAVLATVPADGVPDVTLGQFLAASGFSAYFRTHFMTPLVSCVWSCDPQVALDYPARYLFTFLEHHGMLTVFGSPTWRTVTGGSREYVDRVAATLDEVRLDRKVVEVRETGDGVALTDGDGHTDAYDAVVLATHPDQALAMLADPTAGQREVLASFRYSENLAQLHTDTRLLPTRRDARASWNYQRRATGDGRVLVTYDLTRLMRLPVGPDGTRYLVTLNGADVVDQDTVIATREYAHPIYDPTSVAAQRRLPEVNTARIAFAGAWHGWGFHEDGALAGRRAAEHLGGRWGEPPVPAVPATPAIYRTEIRHARTEPVRNAFRHRSYTWLVDLDALPDHGLLARFEARDHLGAPDRSLRENVEAYLAARGIDLDGGRVLMLAQARQLGHVFNPLSVFWCFGRDGALAGVLLEVHNTYGGRHTYLVHPDGRGRAEVDKALYVSPFNDVSGRYHVAVPVPGERVRVAVTLHRPGHPPFTASLRGERRPADPAGVLRASLRTPLAPLVGALRIRTQGIKLWLRRVPVQPRPQEDR